MRSTHDTWGIRRVRGCVWALCLAFSAAAMFAQFESATLTGIVTDSSGQVIPNVSVKAINEGTSVEAASITNGEGRYNFPSLRPGSYRVVAATTGFKQFVSSGVVLQVNQAARLDIALTIGTVTEEVKVTGEAPVLETESGSRGAVIDHTKIVELPLNGRDYNQLALLSPGVLAPTPRLQSVGFRGVFNVNGNRAFQNAFQLDGVDNTSYSNSFRGLNVQVIQPSVEALQEFKIQTNAYSAEFGRSAGALVNAVIRSGTNELHGSVFEFLRNSELDASNFFANKAGLKKPFRQRNQFGAAAGGPIIKNKTFIFGDYEGLRDAAGIIRFSSVPQPIWRQGMFATADLESLQRQRHGPGFPNSGDRQLQRRKRKLLANSRQPDRSGRAESGQRQSRPEHVLAHFRQQLRLIADRPESHESVRYPRGSHHFHQAPRVRPLLLCEDQLLPPGAAARTFRGIV